MLHGGFNFRIECQTQLIDHSSIIDYTFALTRMYMFLNRNFILCHAKECGYLLQMEDFERQGLE